MPEIILHRQKSSRRSSVRGSAAPYGADLFDDQRAILWCEARRIDFLADSRNEVRIACPQCENSTLFVHPRGWFFCMTCPLSGETFDRLEMAFDQTSAS